MFIICQYIMSFGNGQYLAVGNFLVVSADHNIWCDPHYILYLLQNCGFFPSFGKKMVDLVAFFGYNTLA